MKKILIFGVFLLIAVSLGCKKDKEEGEPWCATGPISKSTLMLAVKSKLGEDMLNDKTVGYYSKEQVQIFKKEADGKLTAIDFQIVPSSTLGNENINFDLIYLDNLHILSTKVIYLKLGEGTLYELSYDLNTFLDEKAFINKKAAAKEKSTTGKWPPLFYLTEHI